MRFLLGWGLFLALALSVVPVTVSAEGPPHKFMKDVLTNSTVPTTKILKPHPKWKKFWADFREGFLDGFGSINNNSGNTLTEQEANRFVVRNHIDLNGLSDILLKTKKLIKLNSRVSQEQLSIIFNNDKHFANIVYKEINSQKRGKPWGYVLGKIVGYIGKLVINNLLNP